MNFKMRQRFIGSLDKVQILNFGKEECDERSYLSMSCTLCDISDMNSYLGGQVCVHHLKYTKHLPQHA